MKRVAEVVSKRVEYSPVDSKVLIGYNPDSGNYYFIEEGVKVGEKVYLYLSVEGRVTLNEDFLINISEHPLEKPKWITEKCRSIEEMGDSGTFYNGYHESLVRKILGTNNERLLQQENNRGGRIPVSFQKAWVESGGTLNRLIIVCDELDIPRKTEPGVVVIHGAETSITNK